MNCKYVFFDIDGILTDGKIQIDSAGNESKEISFVDIDAIFELKRRNYKIGFITGEENNFTQYVEKRFKPDFFVSGCQNKLKYYKEIEACKKVSRDNSCFVGDSRKDIDLLQYVEFSFAPSDVEDEVKRAAKFITKSKRGNGVIREVVNHLEDSINSSENRNQSVSQRIEDHQKVISLLKSYDSIKKIVEMANIIVEVYKKNKKLFICGNGGSAADSQHIAAELVGRFYIERKALNAEALTVNTSILTCLSNDYNFDMIFARQLEAKGEEDDCLLAISTSGRSRNIIEAVKFAKKRNLKVISLLGASSESELSKLSDIFFCIPSCDTPRIQEAHLMVGHLICEIIERELSG